MNSKITRLLAGLAITTTAAFGKTIPNNATANLVLGQAGFTTSNQGTSSTALKLPTGVVVDPTSRKVFVADYGNHRVLRFGSADALANGAAAEAVLGQANFTNALAPFPPTSQSMNNPRGLFIDRLGRLWVADTENSRVLRFSGASQAGNQAVPDRIYGQAGFMTKDPNTTQSGMNLPTGVWVDASDRLWVADSFNHRVLRFDDITNKPSGAPANGVLGQTGFTTNMTGNGQTNFIFPTGLAVSPSGALFVADSSNNRVLRFDNAAGLGNGVAASVVLGQQNFTSTGVGLSASAVNLPYGLTITPDDSLWVCEYANSRLIRFDKASTKPSGAAASGVIGQANFTTNTSSASAQGLKLPGYSPFVDGTGSLWVTDEVNHRVLRYAPDATPPLLTVTAPVKVTKKLKLTIKGTASDTYGISKVEYRVNTGPLKLATGTTAWSFPAKLKKGKNKITVIATDVDGIPSLSKVIRITRK
jgi:sugar lactone lactonase YvrE